MKAKRLVILLEIGFIMLMSLSVVNGQGTSIAVVVNPQNPTSAVSVGELRKLLTGDKHYWPGGAPVKIFTRNEGSAEHNAMLKVLGMSETEFKQYWRSKVYQGDAQSEPVSLPSPGMQREA